MPFYGIRIPIQIILYAISNYQEDTGSKSYDTQSERATQHSFSSFLK